MITVQQIRERDAQYPGHLPDHWTAVRDRRYLLHLLDEAHQADLGSPCKWCKWTSAAEAAQTALDR